MIQTSAAALGLASALYLDLDAIRLALVQTSSNEIELLTTGVLYAAEGDDETASLALTRARSMVPDEPELLAQICIGFAILDRLDKALKTAKMAVAADDGNAAAHYALGMSLFGMEDYPDALSNFERAVSLRPDYYLAHAYNGKFLARMEKWPESRPIPFVKTSLQQMWAAQSLCSDSGPQTSPLPV